MTDRLTEAPPSGFWRRMTTGVAGLKEYLGRRMAEARSRSEFRQEMSRLEEAGDLDRVLNDLGVSRSEAPLIAANQAGAPRRLSGMLRRLGIPLRPSAQNNAAMRALQRSCLLCASTKRCEWWLGGASKADYHSFCPNAQALDELRSNATAAQPAERTKSSAR